jgi:hypothetical protein
MIFRLSQQLARKVKVTPLSELRLADDPLTDWSAHVFNVSRTRYIIVYNTTSLYSTVMYARGVNEPHALIVGALRAIADVMEDDGMLAAYERHVAPGSGTVRFGKALSRSVTGSMNELVAHAQWLLTDEDVSPHDAGLRLNDLLLSTLRGPDGQPYGKPRQTMKRLIDG